MMTPFLRRRWAGPAALFAIALLPLACGSGDEPGAGERGAEARPEVRGPGKGGGSRAELAAAVAARTGSSEREAAAAVDALFDAVSEKLAAGQPVRVPGFGTFTVARRAARAAESPETGERVAISGGATVRFRPGKELREAVAEAPAAAASRPAANGAPPADENP